MKIGLCGTGNMGAAMGARLVSDYGAVLAEVILDAVAFPLDRLV